MHRTKRKGNSFLRTKYIEGNIKTLQNKDMYKRIPQYSLKLENRQSHSEVIDNCYKGFPNPKFL